MARGGAGAAKPVKVGSDGRFCIEVTLLPDSPNSITFTPVDRNGCPGRETLITLWHKSTGKADAGVSSVINVAKNAPVSSDVEPGGGTLLQHVNDGDPLSWVELSFTDIEAGSSCNRFTWIRLDLTKVYIISKIKVRWAQDGGSDYGVCYTVLYSSATSPTNPDPIPGDWKVAKEESNGDDTDQLLSLSPVSARWVALLLYENASFGIQETFKVGELEVWGQDPNVTPPPPPDGCY